MTFPVFPPPHPAQQRYTDINMEIRINTIAIEREQTEESQIANHCLQASLFLKSFYSSRTVLNQPITIRQVLPTTTEREADGKLRKPLASEQNLPPNMRGRCISIISHFPQFLKLTPKTTSIWRMNLILLSLFLVSVCNVMLFIINYLSINNLNTSYLPISFILNKRYVYSLFEAHLLYQVISCCSLIIQPSFLFVCIIFLSSISLKSTYI